MLKEVSPIEIAIHNINEMIKELQLRKQELYALIPNDEPEVKKGCFLINPKTGRRELHGSVPAKRRKVGGPMAKQRNKKV